MASGVLGQALGKSMGQKLELILERSRAKRGHATTHLDPLVEAQLTCLPVLVDQRL